MPHRKKPEVKSFSTTLAACCAAALVTVASSSTSRAAQYPVNQPVPGGIAVIELEANLNDDPTARFGRTPILMLKRNGVWLGVVGIDLDTPPGNYLVTVNFMDKETSSEFSVMPYSYPLKQDTGEQRAPHDEDAPAPWRPELEASFPLMSPARASHLEQFGTHYADEETVHPATWAVLAGIDSVEVIAPGQGVVTDIAERKEAGIYLTIDHGMGLQSSVGPLKQLRKELGESVERGEPLGALGGVASGSRTLSWKVLLNGVAVNPVLVTDQLTAPGPP